MSLLFEHGFLAGLSSPPILLLLVCAPAVGSFLAVLADRLARGEDVLARPSSCRACGTRIFARDLVPVWSYLRLGGRCRTCGAPIPAWLLSSELAALGCALCALVATAGASELAPGPAWLVSVTLWILLTLAISDMLWMRLPDVLTGMLLVLALVTAWLPTIAPVAGTAGMWHALGGAALGAGSFALIRVGYRALRGREGLGAGDVKLMAGLGALTGPADLPLAVLIAAAGALLGVLWQTLRSGRLPPGTHALPFGAALAGAGGLVWLWRLASA